MISIRPFLYLLGFSLIIISCIKEEFVLDDNINVEGLDPSFAVPLGQTSLNLGDLEQNLDEQNFIYNDNDELFAFAYKEDLFDYEISDILDIPASELDFEYELDADQATTITAAPIGTSLDYQFNTEFDLDFPLGAEMDSIILNMSSLILDMESDIKQDISMTITFPTVSLNGVAFQTTIDVEYENIDPTLYNESLDLSNYKVDLSEGGTTFNSLPVEIDFTFTKTAFPAIAGEQIQFNLSFEFDSYQSIWGYFGQATNVLSTDTQEINLFKDLNGGVIAFADPTIILEVFNGVGMDVEIDFASLLAPENSSVTALGGPDLTDIPILEGASNPGETTQTTHIIDNSGTNPMLTDLLAEGPSELIYSASASSNPNGYSQNFALDTSRVYATAEVILPLFLYADGFNFRDTIDVDLYDLIYTGDDNLNHEDVEKITLRVVADNGLPINVGTQIYYADSLDVMVDSLFTNPSIDNIFESGLVNFNLPLNDPEYGKVYQSTRKIVDIILDQDDIQKIVANKADKIILRALGQTNNAGNGEYVKFFPEYSLDLKISAKIDSQINLNE